VISGGTGGAQSRISVTYSREVRSLLTAAALMAVAACATTPVPPAMPPPERGWESPSKLSDGAPGLDKQGLTEFVRARKRSIQACYEVELKKSVFLEGKLVVLFTITPMGTVTKVSTEVDTFPTTVVATCVTAIIKDWVLPFRPLEDVPVAYPFIFAPAS
jgi:hypothetical protein